MALEILSYMEHDYNKTYWQLIDPPFLFHYYGFGWVPRLTFDQWKMVLRVLLGAAVCVSVGFLYYLASVVFFVGFTFLFLQDMSFYLNHFYLVTVFLLVLCFVPANRAFSVDAWLGLIRRRNTVPYWAPWLLTFVMSVVYVHAGIAKMNEDWIRGEPLKHWVPHRAEIYPAFASVLRSPWTALFMSWSGLLLDTFIPFVFMAGPGSWVRWVGFAAIMSFHALNKLLFNIGIFPWVMMTLTFLYFEVNWPERLWAFVRRQRPLPPPVYRPATGTAGGGRRRLSVGQLVTLALLALFALQQTLTPLRHYLYPGDVTWNEEGHRFSWRMKLRDKAGMAKFYVVDPKHDNYTEEVDYRHFLAWRQVVKMAGRPEMIHLFADHVANEFETEFGHRPAVHAVVIGSVNFRTPQFMVDPRVNLAAIPPWTWPNTWVIQMLPRHVTKHIYIPEGRPTDDPTKDRLFHMFGHLSLKDFLNHFKKIDAAAQSDNK